MAPNPAKKPALTDEEKQYLLQINLEHELAHLKREHFSLDRAHSHSFVSRSQIRNARVLSIFNREHKNIVTDLRIATSDGKKKEDAKLSLKLTDLLNEFNRYNSSVSTEKTRIAEIESQIKMVKKNVLYLRSKQVTDRQYEDRVWKALKILETLENKLEVQIVKFDTINAQNHELRTQINHLLWDRRNFLTIWNRLIENLCAGKKIMLDLIEQATVAYDKREEWCKKLQALRHKAHTDMHQNAQEMRNITCKQDNSAKLEDFLNTKGQRRVMRDLRNKEVEKRNQRRIKLENLLDRYQSMLQDIKTFTNCGKVDAMSAQFNQYEHENFMNFKFITDTITEMESVNDNLSYLQIEFDAQQILLEGRGKQQLSRLGDLQEQVANVTALCEGGQKTLNEKEAQLAAVIAGINTLFRICKCSNDPLLKLLSDNSTINQYNVLLYLQVLESKVQAVLLEVYFTEKHKFDRRKITSAQRLINEVSEPPVVYLIEEIVLSNPCALCVEHEMVSDVTDRIEKVVTKKEAEEKLQQRLLLPDGIARIHNISKCHLPKARNILQKRYE